MSRPRDIIIEVVDDPGSEFVLMPRQAVVDRRLSSTALGVLARLHNDPPAGAVELDDLAAVLCSRSDHQWDSPEQIRAALVELRDRGYLRRPGGGR